MNKQWVVEPRHGFFAKDGRGWYAGAGNRGNSLSWLLPTTLRGALCTAVGRELERQRPSLLTPQEWLDLKAEIKLRTVLALRSPVGLSFATANRMWPAPADAVHLAGHPTPSRLITRPTEADWWDGSDDPRLRALKLLTLDPAAVHANAKPDRGPAWWTEAEFIDWLGGDPIAGPRSDVQRYRQTQTRTDIHVKMDADTGAAETGFLWEHQFQETLTLAEVAPTGGTPGISNSNDSVCRWAFGVSVEISGEQAAGACPSTATLAGDRHLAAIEKSGDLTVFPEAYHQTLINQQPGSQLRLYATSPTVFADGWCPPGFELENGQLVGKLPVFEVPVRLLAAAIGRPVPISGWDLVAAADEPDQPARFARQAAGSPRSTLLACPPGSMWLVERLDGQNFSTSDVQALWLTSWGIGTDDGLGGLVAGLNFNG